MSRPTTAAWSVERRFTASAAAVWLAVVWTHALAAGLRHLAPEAAPLAAWPLSVAAVAVTLAATAAWPRPYGAEPLAAGLGAAAAALLEATLPGSGVAALSVPVAATAAALVGRRFGAALPAALDGTLSRHRRVAMVWGVVVLACLAQTSRLATFMTDSDTDWFLSTRHPLWADHECLPAYVYGAELCERGVDNVYAAEHYPGLNREAAPETAIEGMHPEDPFQYPPQFLLLPWLATRATRDYRTIRVVWFALQATLFLGSALALARWVGGREGARAAALIPVALLAFPVLHALQFGQLHLTAVALSIAALLAFENDRWRLGGALLAVAILGKIFPGLLLVPLLLRRRFRALAWTAVFGAAITAAALVALGPSPFLAFVDYQVPRLASGEAFAFHEVWPEARAMLIADNQGAYGLMLKLREMGLTAVSGTVAAWGGRLFGLAALALAAVFGLGEARASRRARAAGWLAVLGLGSLASGGAFGDYVPLVAIWLLTLSASELTRGWRLALPFGACAAFQFFLVGTAPVGPWFSPEVMLPLSALGAVLMLSLFVFWTAVPLERLAASQERDLQARAPAVRSVAVSPARSGPRTPAALSTR